MEEKKPYDEDDTIYVIMLLLRGKIAYIINCTITTVTTIYVGYYLVKSFNVYKRRDLEEDRKYFSMIKVMHYL
jgi:hypothetical protein